LNRLRFFVESAKFEVWAYEVAEIMITCFTFYRSPEQQKIEYEAGRSSLLFGKHQQWLAKDYCVVYDLNKNWIINKNEIRWSCDLNNPNDPYLILGTEWEKRGGIWGGRWKVPFDPYHFEG